MKKISEFLSELDSHSIYESEPMKKDFKEQTGQEPVWGEYTERQTAEAMESRGLGGYMNPADGKKLCYGYDVAKSLAQKHAPGYRCTKMGRGFAFQEALEALRNAGN